MHIPARRLAAMAKHVYVRYEEMTPEERERYLALGRQALARVQRHVTARQPSEARTPSTPRITRPAADPRAASSTNGTAPPPIQPQAPLGGLS